MGLRVLHESWILLSHFPSSRGLVLAVSVIWRTRILAKGVRIGRRAEQDESGPGWYLDGHLYGRMDKVADGGPSVC